LVDELVLFNGPKVIGGDGMSALGTLGVTVLEDAPRFDLLEHRAIGGDVMSRWRVA
jgi:diaminohydroxyphosphoribosylaminopyrimidine deaminase/5-amino-6-(5-phosphoribosylamino)uracil reductase